MQLQLCVISFGIQDPDPTVDDGDGITDNEGDGIWDTAVIVIGIRFDMNGTEIDGRVDPKDPNSGNRIYDHRAFIDIPTIC